LWKICSLFIRFWRRSNWWHFLRQGKPCCNPTW
jgi:hypothetical protein